MSYPAVYSEYQASVLASSIISAYQLDVIIQERMI